MNLFATMVKIQSSSVVLRLLTYNVRRFTDRDGVSSSVPTIAATLRELRPDVVCLNEVDLNLRPSCLSELVQQSADDNNNSCSWKYRFYGHVKNGKYGNAILWNADLLEQDGDDTVVQTQLPGGSKVVVKPGTRLLNGDVVEEERSHRIVRGLLGVRLRWKPSEEESATATTTTRPRTPLPFWVFGSHLDHISDDERVIQLKFVRDTIRRHASHHDDAVFFLGDLNALTRSDYSSEQWRVLEERARANRWAAPVDSTALRELREDGWRDLFIFPEKHTTPLDRLDSSQKCSAHGVYRIDYVWANNPIHRANVKEARVCTQARGSDHWPVLVEVDMTNTDDEKKKKKAADLES